MNNSLAMKQSKGYRILAFVILFFLAVFFIYPLYLSLIHISEPKRPY